MAKLDILGGTTSVITQVFIQDSTSTGGAGLPNLTATSAGLTAYYALPGIAATAITLATQTATGVFASGGFCAIDNTNMPGFYRFDALNAMLASTSRSCGVLMKGATNMAPLPIEIQITGWNNQDGQRGGLLSLPTVVPSLTGGMALAVATTGGVRVDQWAGASTATNQTALATAPISVNVTSWAGFAAATTQIAVATSPISTNVTSWAGAPTATTQSAIATTPAVNVIQWASAPTATTQTALATLINVAQWAGFAAATTQLAIATTAPLATTSYDAVWAVTVDGTVTAAQSLRLANSANGGLLSGATTSAVAVRDLANTKNRILASGDLTGNRFAVTLDLT